MREYSVRALVYHVSSEKIKMGINFLEDAATRLASLRDELKSEFNILSTRFVLPIREWDKELGKLAKVVRDNGVDFIAAPLKEPKSVSVLELLSTDPGVFTSIPYVQEKEREILNVIREIPEKIDWIATSRFGVAFGERLTTPYFPVTASNEEGVSISLLYVNYLGNRSCEGKKLSKIVDETINDVIREVAQGMRAIKWNTSIIGVDPSLSPWMEESVAAFIERQTRVTFGLPGTFSKIREINEELSEVSERITGYNEVMIPLAEDNRLKELAKLGSLRFRDLIHLVASCVVGLDMVYIPSSTSDDILRGVLRDLNSIQRLKRRSLGLRIGLVGAEPGEEIQLGRFGNVPVIEPID